ncbi:MAG: ABC transporter ATP-binding protein [Peptococcaceae bacterium]|nr:ABC transporter ATP-binding protein [Peptococcaceae bacterium]
MSLIRQCIQRYRAALIVALLCMSVSLIADLMIPWLLQILIDDGVAVSNAVILKRTGLWMFVVITISLLASIIAYWLSARAAAQIGQYLRKTLYEHILSLSYEAFNTISASTLITRLSNDVLQIQNMFLMVQRVAIGLPISFIVGLFLSIQLSPDLSLTFIVTVPLLCLNIGFYVRFSARYFPRIQETIDKINLSAQEMLVGILTIKGVGAAAKIVDKFTAFNNRLLTLNLTIQKRFSFVAPTSMIIFNEAIVVVLCLGFFGFTSDIGKLIAFISYSMQILSCITRASGVLTMMTRAQASVTRIEEIMTIPEATPVAHQKIPSSWDLHVEHLSYRFPHAPRAQLDDITCQIPFGQRVGIVGLPGSGKTLFLDAITGLLTSTQDTIRYGDVPLSHISRSWLKKNIGYVQQRPTILAGTIQDNLLLAREDLSLSEMTTALDNAVASELYQNNEASVERGILQRGHDLSGGQKQRLSIARILALRPHVLILDDSTSALDHATEYAFFAHLNTMQPQTQIIVSQRLSTLRQCNTIFLFDHGRIVAQGSHTELLQTTPLYEMILGDQMIEEALNDV